MAYTSITYSVNFSNRPQSGTIHTALCLVNQDRGKVVNVFNSYKAEKMGPGQKLDSLSKKEVSNVTTLEKAGAVFNSRIVRGSIAFVLGTLAIGLVLGLCLGTVVLSP